ARLIGHQDLPHQSVRRGDAARVLEVRLHRDDQRTSRETDVLRSARCGEEKRRAAEQDWRNTGVEFQGWSVMILHSSQKSLIAPCRPSRLLAAIFAPQPRPG